MKKLMVVMVFCLCAALAMGLASGKPAAQGKSVNASGGTGTKVDPTAATVVFWDRDTDQIKSDGLGPYVNGGNIRCYVQQNYSGAEILLNLQRVNAGKRAILYDFTNILGTGCDPDANGPVGTVRDTGYIAIMNAANIPIGATVARLGIFYTNAVGAFRFLPSTNTGNSCSVAVVVHRPDRTTWIVTTDPPDPDFPFIQGIQVGDVAQLGDGTSFQGNYLMSFGMTVTCPGCQPN